MHVSLLTQIYIGVLTVLNGMHLTTSQQESAELQLGKKWFEDKNNHQLKNLDSKTIQELVHVEDSVSFEQLLDPMLIPRVPGTANHAKVIEFIKNHMTRLGWAVETDAFHDNTPYGPVPFQNIIATLNPNTPRRLVLACHFDSKYYSDNFFVGATDSAVPCAMLLHMASTMRDMLSAHKSSEQDVTLQFIFFDGEEAFQYWRKTDSLYGSRHLAAKWDNTPYPDNNQDGTTILHRIDMLILLDLLGTSDPTLYSYFHDTAHWHKALFQTEQQLKQSRYWSASGSSRHTIFQSRRWNYGVIADDHVPFLNRGVDILHIIPHPFPGVWHKSSDTKAALDFTTISNLNKVFRVFVARYLHIPATN